MRGRFGNKRVESPRRKTSKPPPTHTHLPQAQYPQIPAPPHPTHSTNMKQTACARRGDISDEKHERKPLRQTTIRLRKEGSVKRGEQNTFRTKLHFKTRRGVPAGGGGGQGGHVGVVTNDSTLKRPGLQTYLTLRAGDMMMSSSYSEMTGSSLSMELKEELFYGAGEDSM